MSDGRPYPLPRTYRPKDVCELFGEPIPEVRAMYCDACEGTGHKLYWKRNHDGSEDWWMSREQCPSCDGTGLVLVEVEPIEEEELTR